jgi:Tol biopolymer transport system component/C-terminal processing protease CtpA/Prc
LTVVLTLTGPTLQAADEALWLRYPVISPDGSTIVFSYHGDLWVVPASGGTATPLTLHEAHDSMPVWSRDGSTIAFASDRYGNFDVWTIAAAGGEPTRLTYHSANDTPTSFDPEGSAVLFSSARLDAATNVQFPTGAQPELYAVSLEGGMPRQVLSTPALYAVHDRNGNRVAYSDWKGYENRWRKHDDSSFASDLWMLDVGSGEHTQLTELGHDDRQPVWGAGDETLFFLSERSGSFNVWQLDPADPAAATQVTNHSDHPVRFLSASAAGDLAYAYDGTIWVRPAGAGESRRLTVSIAADRRTNRRQRLDVSSSISEYVLSPDGGEIAFIARGEVFVTSADHGATRRITNTPEQERSVSFSPDGRSLLYASERGGSWSLYRSDLTDDDEPDFFNATAIEERPVLVDQAEAFQPRFSPDGKEVAYLHERTELRILNLNSGDSRTVLPGDINYSYRDGDQWFEWSPDGTRLLVDFLSPTRWSREIGLVAADGEGELINLTRSGYEDFIGHWVLEGEAAIWFTDRYGSRQQAGWPAQFDVHLAFFTEAAWDRWRLSEAELEQVEEKEKKDKKKDEGKEDGDEKDKDEGEDEDEDEIKLPDPVDIKLDGLEDRTIRLTTHSSRLGDAVLTPDGERLLYLARFEKGFDLWSYQHRKQEIKLLAKLNAEGVGDLVVDKEGKHVFFLADQALKKVEISSAKVKPVKLTALMELDAEAERAYIFEHVWRQTLKKFHDPGMHGADWPALKQVYSRFLPHISNNWDFAEMLSEMLGELNASHTGSGHRPQHAHADSTASLGLFPDPEWQQAGVRILEVIEGGPLQKAETRIKAGIVIEAIDGKTIAAGANWYPLLNNKAGNPVRLNLRDLEQDETWHEVVKPISSDRLRQLLYERWVRGRRAEVERLSGGRIGYAHIRGMSDGPFRQVFEDVFGRELTKEAIVLDTRFNGGGNLVEPLTVFLSGETYMTARPRGQLVGSEPSMRWTKPSIVVQNEGNYSDAHCFPVGYRTLGLGETVGTQVPGTCTAVWWEPQQDRSLYFGIPEVTWVDVEGDPLENKHFDPDHWVDNDPKLEAEGRDQQLEKAVEVLLAKLDG